MNKLIGAGAFKQGCLALLDEVNETRCEIVVTKRGKPVARLVPIQDPAEIEAQLLGQLRQQGEMLVSEDEFLAPTWEEAGWGDVG